MNIGDRIKYFRELSGLSGKKLAEKAGLDSSQIYKLESNNTNPSIESLERICNVLGISLSEFFSESPAPSQPTYVRKLIAAVDGLDPITIDKLIRIIQTIKSEFDLD